MRWLYKEKGKRRGGPRTVGRKGQRIQAGRSTARGTNHDAKICRNYEEWLILLVKAVFQLEFHA